MQDSDTESLGIAWAMQARGTSDYSPTAKASALDAKQTIANAEVFQNKIQEILSKLLSDKDQNR